MRLTNRRFRILTPRPLSKGDQSNECEDDEKDERKDKGKKETCVWGGNYLWKDCLYLNEAKQPGGWKPNEDIRKNFSWSGKNQLVEDSSLGDKLTGFLTSHFNASEEYIAISQNYSYSLRFSFILDSGAGIHVCNDASRFKNLSNSWARGHPDCRSIHYTDWTLWHSGDHSRTRWAAWTPAVWYGIGPFFSYQRCCHWRSSWPRTFNGIQRGKHWYIRELCFYHVTPKHEQWLLEYTPLTE